MFKPSTRNQQVL